MAKEQEKFIGLDVSMVIQPEESMTEQDQDLFTDKFIELVESFGWICGGSIGLIDLNEEEEFEK